MKTDESTNEYGTQVSHHVCDTCGFAYTVTPAVNDGHLFANCMDEACPSYNPAHDLEPAFDSKKELIKREVVSIEALRLRREID